MKDYSKLYWATFYGLTTFTGVAVNHPRLGKIFMGHSMKEARECADKTVWFPTK